MDVMIVRKNGSQVTTTYDGDDFIIEAARGLPPPVVERISEYLGISIKSFFSHPADVMIAIVWLLARQGQFDVWGSGAKRHAQEIDEIINVAFNGQSLEQIRIEMQLYLLWQQTELRGKFLVGFASRTAGGTFVSAPLYSLGGKLAGPETSLLIFLLGQIGAAVRVAHQVLKKQKHDNQVASYLHAFVTGSADGLNFEKELGATQVAAIRNILRDNPNAIRLGDPELKFLDWLTKFAISAVEEGMRLLAQLKHQDPKSDDSGWRIPRLNDLIPNELPVPTIWPNELPDLTPGFPGWNIPWGLPH